MYTTDWHSRHNLNYRLKTKFKRKTIALQKKNPKISPFSPEGNLLASHWWGKAWNAHLKKYTFNTIRLEKGKLNFRCGALADFKVKSKRIKAIVLGSKIEPYYVTIKFEPIAKIKWRRIQKLYNGHLEWFEKVLDNQIPKEMSDLFTQKPTGIFPSPDEISFECTCSDRSNLCKHTAVALYGLGTKIDMDFQLLFKLRGVDILELISQSIHEERENILKKVKTKNPKVLKSTNLSEIFKIEIQQ